MSLLGFLVLTAIVIALANGVRKPTSDNSDQWDLF